MELSRTESELENELRFSIFAIYHREDSTSLRHTENTIRSEVITNTEWWSSKKCEKMKTQRVELDKTLMRPVVGDFGISTLDWNHDTRNSWSTPSTSGISSVARAGSPRDPKEKQTKNYVVTKSRQRT